MSYYLWKTILMTDFIDFQRPYKQFVGTSSQGSLKTLNFYTLVVIIQYHYILDLFCWRCKGGTYLHVKDNLSTMK